MIVECINDNWYNCNGKTEPPYPVKNELYEVTDTVVGGPFNHKYYVLHEFPGRKKWDTLHFREVDVDITDLTVKTKDKILV